jgi:hypothetical protein
LIEAVNDMSWIIRGDRLIERDSPEDIATRLSTPRSGFPAPKIVRDTMGAVRSMQDGKVYDSRSALYRSYRAAGLRIVEKGEPIEALNPMSDMRNSDVLKAIGKVKGGCKPRLEMEDDG